MNWIYTSTVILWSFIAISNHTCTLWYYVKVLDYANAILYDIDQPNNNFDYFDILRVYTSSTGMF